MRLQLRELVDAGAAGAGRVPHERGREPRARAAGPGDLPRGVPGAPARRASRCCSRTRCPGRKGEYVRATSTIIDAFLHSDHVPRAVGTLELNLREHGLHAADAGEPQLRRHGAAELHRRAADRPLRAGRPASRRASISPCRPALGNVVATDMGGTSFDIGIVAEGGVKHYDFKPVIDRWLVSVPMIHLVTLGRGRRLDRPLRPAVPVDRRVGPQSAGSDPGPGLLRPRRHAADGDRRRPAARLPRPGATTRAAGSRSTRSVREFAIEEELGDHLDLDAGRGREADQGARSTSTWPTAWPRSCAPAATCPRTSRCSPTAATAAALLRHRRRISAIDRVLAPPFSSVFSALGAGNMPQLHIHETTPSPMMLFDATSRARSSTDFDAVQRNRRRARGNAAAQTCCARACAADRVRHRLELDMRYGNQLVTTAVVADRTRLRAHPRRARADRPVRRRLRPTASARAASRPEAGIRITTVRVCSYVEAEHGRVRRLAARRATPRPATAASASASCHFVGVDGAVDTPVYDETALAARHCVVDGPAVVTTPHHDLPGRAGLAPRRPAPRARSGSSKRRTEADHDRLATQAFSAEDQALRRPVPRRDHAVPRTRPGDHARPPDGAAHAPRRTGCSSGPIDANELDRVRKRIVAGLDEAFEMMEQMGAAPGAKWGDLTSAVYTASGDLVHISTGGVLAFAVRAALPGPVHQQVLGRRSDGRRARRRRLHPQRCALRQHPQHRPEHDPAGLPRGRAHRAGVATIIHEGENGAKEPGGHAVAARSRPTTTASG